MICPECETEYREGFTRCSDCDVDLVVELEAPALVPLTMESSPELVAALLEVLESENVPYVITAGTAIPVLDGDEESKDAPFLWTARIWVTPEKSEDGAAILAEIRATLKQR